MPSHNYGLNNIRIRICFIQQNDFLDGTIKSVAVMYGRILPKMDTVMTIIFPVNVLV